MALNEKQELFCEEFLIDLNATQAALRAGYSKDTAYSQGSRLLKHDEIRTRIEEKMDERSKRTLVTSDFVVDGLVDVANRCRKATPVMEYDPESGGMIQKKDEDGNAVWEFDSQGANKALELLGKHLGIFIDKSKIEQSGNMEIVVKYADRNNPTPTPPDTAGVS